tara:strand:+ start:1390 stop:2316 length:927 start_codon:yes stop_codon:yes gene_type:complete
MGTQYAVTVADRGKRDPGVLEGEIETLLEVINATMSTYDPASELSRLNKNRTTAWIPISEDLYTVLRTSVSVGIDSGGAFDATVGPLVNLWGFGPDRGIPMVPGGDTLAKARTRVGVDMFELQERPHAFRKRHPDVYVDLSGVAKGYAVDRVATLLQSTGHINYLVDIGGEFRAKGRNSKGQEWTIGIEGPVNGGRLIAIRRTIVLRNAGLASSGNYRNYFERDGVRYGHTIDPRTGAPVQHNLAAVTVLDETAMLADAWATALMSLGFQAGRRVAEEHDLSVYFIVTEGEGTRSYTTPAFDLAVGDR